MDYRLPTIPFMRLRCSLEAQESALLSAFKGSMLRGAFGHALRRSVCAMEPGQSCNNCMLNSKCAYTRLFETLVGDDAPPFLKGLPTSPRPFIFDCRNLHREFKRGEILSFDLLLLGNSGEYYPYIVFALKRMAEQGLSRRHHTFILKQVDVQIKIDNFENKTSWQTLYDHKRTTLSENPVFLTLPQNGNFDSEIVLHFLTPTRIKVRDRLVIEFDFRTLVFKMIRRTLEIAHFYAPGQDIDWEFHPLLQAADKINIVQHRLRWIDWQRHSNRQQQNMKLGGFIGSLRLQGDLAPFTSLLHTSQLLHVGKGATFGLGKMAIEQSNSRSQA
jgi:hypothetical protein